MTGTDPGFTTRVYGIVADILNVPRAQISPDSSSSNVATWDSVHHLNLILALEQAFDLQLEPEEIDAMNSVGQILSILSQKLGAKA